MVNAPHPKHSWASGLEPYEANKKQDLSTS